MTWRDDGCRITDLAQLEAIYGEPSPASIVKEIDYLHPHYRAFIEAAPFLAVATSGPEGLDCSPRGDPAGFVRVADERTVMIPDRRGNNRIDSMKNLVRDPRIALLFMIPGVSETIRINGRAAISADPELAASFTMNGMIPKSVLVVTVERIYFQCSKALVRSKLWDPATRIERRALPSAGEILAACSRGEVGAEEYDRIYPERIRQTLY